MVATALSSPTPATTELAERLRECVAAGNLELPMLSRTAGEVIALCSGEDTDARALAAMIQQDPALAAEILRIANSASFAAGNAIVSLQQAIGRMGLERVRTIALAIALKSDLFRSKRHEQRLQMVWREAVAAAAWSREVARACRVNAEMAYLGGLLHNIGEPVLLRAIDRLEPNAGDDTIAAVVAELAAAAGESLVQRWSLPAPVARVIREHDDAECADGTVRIVSAAIWLTSVDGDAPSEQLVGAPPLGRVNLYAEDVEKLWKGRAKVEQMVAALAL